MVISVWRSGAGEGIRTLDPLLGKQMLCQLSYARLRPPILAHAVAPGSDAYQRLFCEVVSKRRASVLVAVDVRLWINGSSIIWPLGTVIEALLPITSWRRRPSSLLMPDVALSVCSGEGALGLSGFSIGDCVKLQLRSAERVRVCSVTVVCGYCTIAPQGVSMRSRRPDSTRTSVFPCFSFRLKQVFDTLLPRA